MILLESKIRKISKFLLNIIIIVMIFFVIKNIYLKIDEFLKLKQEINYKNTLYNNYKTESLKQKIELKSFFDFLDKDLNSYLIDFDYKYPLSPNATVMIITEGNTEIETVYDFNIISSFKLNESQITFLNIRGD